MRSIRRKAIGTLVGLTACMAAAASTASAATIVDGGTQDYYNAGLGDLYAYYAALTSNPTQTVFPKANSANGDPLIPPVAMEPNLSGVENLGTWLTNAAPTGGTWSTGVQAIPSTWAVNSETAIVYALDAGATGLSNFHMDFGVDNGIYVWLDGIYLFGAMAPGGAALSEYDIDLAFISSGTHYLQILREDHGGGTGFAILATGDYAAPIPEPTTMLLLGSGLVGLAGYGRRRKE